MAVPREIVQRSIDHARERIEVSQGIIDCIEQEGWQFFEGRGAEELRDVTEVRLERHKANIKRDQELIAAYERLLDAQQF